jgi:hypothetical protein
VHQTSSHLFWRRCWRERGGRHRQARACVCLRQDLLPGLNTCRVQRCCSCCLCIRCCCSATHTPAAGIVRKSGARSTQRVIVRTRSDTAGIPHGLAFHMAYLAFHLTLATTWAHSTLMMRNHSQRTRQQRHATAGSALTAAVSKLVSWCRQGDNL